VKDDEWPETAEEGCFFAGWEMRKARLALGFSAPGRPERNIKLIVSLQSGGIEVSHA
jgi:hypothetical protein